MWRLGLRTIHAAATRDCRLVLWVWHSRLLLGREDLLARHHVPMRRRARLAFLADVRGVPSGSPFVPWRAAAAEGVATPNPNDARSLIQARGCCSLSNRTLGAIESLQSALTEVAGRCLAE